MRYSPLSLLLSLSVLAAPADVIARESGDYPSRAVRVVVGLSPGGGTDIQARLFSKKLTESTGKTFFVENRTGAGGTIAYTYVSQAAPDGYTLLAVASGYSITPAIYTKLQYDAVKDFEPISLVVRAPLLLLTHPSVPVTGVRQLLALAKSQPGALDCASAGVGSSTHMAFELFRTSTGLKITHIPYRGTGQALIDTIAGNAHMMFANVLSSLGHVKNGKLRALAVTTDRRSPVLPNLPTISESGAPGYETSTWHAWLAPAGTPAPIVRRLNAELVKSLSAPDVAGRLEPDGAERVGSTPDALRRILITEIARWRKVVKDAGIERR